MDSKIFQDIFVPLCILKTSYYVSACEKDGKTPLWGEGAGLSACEKDGKTLSQGEGAESSAIFLFPPQGILSEILPCIVPPYNEMGSPPLHAEHQHHLMAQHTLTKHQHVRQTGITDATSPTDRQTHTQTSIPDVTRARATP